MTRADDGAGAMDRIFPGSTGLHSHPVSHSLGAKAPDRRPGKGLDLEPPIGIEPMTYSLGGRLGPSLACRCAARA